ncbi:putative Taz1-interacting factor 1 [Hortaea werneckii]|nr:putative Taz1-interacting factor 1 [Hortaea werneckii]
MEAQQREFANERRTLERELSEAKERIEEVENEMDRLMGSRDNERDNVDARTAAFEEEIARLKEDAMGHAARAATAQDARAALERKLEAAQSERNEAIGELQSIKVQREEREEAENEQLQLLATAHNHLEPNGNAPEDLASFASLLEELARRSAAHSKDLEEAVAFAKSENESLSANNERQRVELTTAAEKHGELEESIRKAEEAHAVEQAKMQSLQLQLSDEQQQLKDLRSKFAEGETGSEVLRQRIADEEAKSGKLSWELAEANSHINSMDVELMRLQKKHKAYHTSAEASSERLQKRADRAKEVSQRLYSEQTRLVRCLERLGLAITYDGDTMVIDRASKMGASTNMSDMRGHMDRTISLTSPPPTRKSSTTEEALSQSQDLSFIHWSDAQSAEEETAQYEAFLQHVARFDVDAFTDGVHKRLRDYEYTAKKYNKEGREANRRAEGYKEKAGKLKAEAHAKIAVKDFKEGDLALFLPTRGQAKGAWAAFNIGCPHYFLAEKEGMRLGSRDFIVARISKVEQRVVDLSKPQPSNTDGRSVGEGNEAPSIEDDNPFDLSDGLTWWMVHAVEERGPGAAPTTPGLGKSTVAAANVDARGSIRIKRSSKGDDASKHLNKSLDSRRSSSTSKKGATLATGVAGSPTLSQHTPDPQVSRQRSDSQASLRPPPAQISSSSAPTSGLGVVANANDDGPQSEQVRKDLMWGP